WFSIGDERIGQGRDSAKRYLEEHPALTDELEKKVRENMDKLALSRGKSAAKPAGKGVDVSADDFDET
ncbi:MAG: DNA recombination/repair protein RecA, partial [Oscillospiraceae bacterium]|nr:DNA recombination/repair protein RecA [Oscillospiraceae bacterium]